MLNLLFNKHHGFDLFESTKEPKQQEEVQTK